jgi:protein FrlC
MFRGEQLLGANFSFQHHPFRWTAEHLAELGFKRIELWGIAPHIDLHNDTAKRVAEVRSVLGDCRLSVHCFTPEQVIYPVNIASGDTIFREASIEHFLRAADIAAELEAKYLFLAPGRGFENEPKERAWDHAVESINRIDHHARSLGLRCLLEPLQRRESNIVNNANDLEKMWLELGSRSLDIVLDLVAMATAGDNVSDYVSKFGARLSHVHIVDGNPGGHLVWGDGNLPLERYLAALNAASFDGTLTFEPFGDGSYALDPLAAWERNLKAISPYVKNENY